MLRQDSSASDSKITSPGLDKQGHSQTEGDLIAPVRIQSLKKNSVFDTNKYDNE